MSSNHRQTPALLPRSGLLALQKNRLQQILLLLALVFLAIGLNNLFRDRYLAMLLEWLTVGVLLAAMWRNHKNATRQAAAIMISTLFISLAVLTFSNQGLFDEGPMAFPTLLMFAGMTGSRRLLWVLTALMMLFLCVVFVLHQLNIVPSIPDPAGFTRIMLMLIVVALSGFSVWLIANDLNVAVTQLKAEKQALQDSHAKVEYLAQRDNLTGLPNRALAKDRLDTLLLQTHRTDHMTTVIFLDLDNFKTINDSLGHAAGDELLRQIATTLRACVRESDTVARISGDEFLVILGGIQGEEVIVTVVGKISHALGQAFTLNGVDVLVTASMGIAVAPRDGRDSDTLLKNADLAMYRAKDAGRNTFHFFDPSMEESAVEQLRIASSLRTALTNDELELHYQPQVHLQTGEIIGAEALLRWRHPKHGFIPPDKFIPIAERSGLIDEVGTWVLRHACTDAATWLNHPAGPLTVAINVSALQFRRGNIEQDLASALAEAKLPASAIELELTESSLLGDAQHLSEVLQRLSQSGIRIAIDDFGTGYSNLGYLRRFAVHRLKIDQSFVRNLCSNPHDEGLVRAIIEMAHCLNLQAVAEGVEDAETRSRLNAFGCEFAQGYLWSKPLPKKEFDVLLQQHVNI